MWWNASLKVRYHGASRSTYSPTSSPSLICDHPAVPDRDITDQGKEERDVLPLALPPLVSREQRPKPTPTRPGLRRMASWSGRLELKLRMAEKDVADESIASYPLYPFTTLSSMDIDVVDCPRVPPPTPLDPLLTVANTLRASDLGDGSVTGDSIIDVVDLEELSPSDIFSPRLPTAPLLKGLLSPKEPISPLALPPTLDPNPSLDRHELDFSPYFPSVPLSTALSNTTDEDRMSLDRRVSTLYSSTIRSSFSSISTASSSDSRSSRFLSLRERDVEAEGSAPSLFNVFPSDFSLAPTDCSSPKRAKINRSFDGIPAISFPEPLCDGCDAEHQGRSDEENEDSSTPRPRFLLPRASVPDARAWWKGFEVASHTVRERRLSAE